MITMSRKADYGLVFLTVLAAMPEKSFASVRVIAKQHKMPYTFLAKIASELKELGVLESKEGLGGGFRLASKPEDITLAEVVQKLDGPIAPVVCMRQDNCSCQSSCVHKSVLEDISASVQQTMENYSLADLIGNN